MKSVLREFYFDNPEEVFGDCFFVFDANVLLNLYRCSTQARNKLLKILGEDEIIDRIWMPHQFALEYQRNRLGVIIGQEIEYGILLNDIEGIEKKHTRHPFVNISELVRPIKTSIKSKKKRHPDWFHGDIIKDRIDVLFDGKVGSPFSSTRENEIFIEGKSRYDENIPPGYRDNAKDGNSKFGDLLGWYQIIDFAIEKRKPIVFICDDKKDDWWLDIKGRTIGPRIELRRELFSKAGVGLYMYRFDEFIKYAGQYLLEEEVDAHIIDEIQQSDSSIVEVDDTGQSFILERDVGSDSISVSKDDACLIEESDVGQSGSTENL